MLKNSKEVPAELPSDDEVEKFHKSRDKLSLNPADDSASEDDEEEDGLEEAVYNLSDDVGADTDEDDESDEDDDDRLAECESTSRAWQHMLGTAPLPVAACCPGMTARSLSLYLSSRMSRDHDQPPRLVWKHPCVGAVKRQEKALRAKLRLQQGEDEDGDEDVDDEEDDGLWGGKKRAYYGEADQEEARLPTCKECMCLHLVCMWMWAET